MKKFILILCFVLFSISIFAQSISRPISIKKPDGTWAEVTGTSQGYVNFSIASSCETIASTTVYTVGTSPVAITAITGRTYVAIIATQSIYVTIGTTTIPVGLCPTYGESYSLVSSVTVGIAGYLATTAITVKQTGVTP